MKWKLRKKCLCENGRQIRTKLKEVWKEITEADEHEDTQALKKLLIRLLLYILMIIASVAIAVAFAILTVMGLFFLLIEIVSNFGRYLEAHINELIGVGLFVAVVICFVIWIKRKSKTSNTNIQETPRVVTQIPSFENIHKNLKEWAYQVIVYLGTALPSPIRTPVGVEETYANAEQIDGVNMFVFSVPIQSGHSDTALDLNDVRQILQTGFNNLLMTGNRLSGQPYMIDSNNIKKPIIIVDGESMIYIAEVFREKLRLVVRAFWINNGEMSRYVKNWRELNQGGGGCINVDTTSRGY